MEVDVLRTGRELIRQARAIVVADVVIVRVEQVEHIQPQLQVTEPICNPGVYQQRIVCAYRTIFDKRRLAQVPKSRRWPLSDRARQRARGSPACWQVVGASRVRRGPRYLARSHINLLEPENVALAGLAWSRTAVRMTRSLPLNWKPRT